MPTIHYIHYIRIIFFVFCLRQYIIMKSWQVSEIISSSDELTPLQRALHVPFKWSTHRKHIICGGNYTYPNYILCIIAAPRNNCAQVKKQQYYLKTVHTQSPRLHQRSYRWSNKFVWWVNSMCVCSFVEDVCYLSSFTTEEQYAAKAAAAATHTQTPRVSFFLWRRKVPQPLLDKCLLLGRHGISDVVWWCQVWCVLDVYYIADNCWHARYTFRLD